jgi:predicted CopG family antitoxin
MEKTEATTIQVSKETREKLADMGKKGETYDEIINKLIETAKKYSGGS